jgi:hypothetical protein
LALWQERNREVSTELPIFTDDNKQAQWLLAHLLDWHRREAKAPWWEFIRLRDLTEEELLDEKAAVAGLCVAGPVLVTILVTISFTGGSQPTVPLECYPE